MRWCLCVVSIYCSTQKIITLCTKEADDVATATRIREKGSCGMSGVSFFPIAMLDVPG